LTRFLEAPDQTKWYGSVSESMDEDTWAARAEEASTSKLQTRDCILQSSYSQSNPINL
jgi:hypothetical protein